MSTKCATTAPTAHNDDRTRVYPDHDRLSTRMPAALTACRGVDIMTATLHLTPTLSLERRGGNPNGSRDSHHTARAHYPRPRADLDLARGRRLCCRRRRRRHNPLQ